jgi:hypothetical protein
MRRLNTRLYAKCRLLVWSVVAATVLAACSSNSLRAFFGPPDDEMEETDIALMPPPSSSAVLPRDRAPQRIERGRAGPRIERERAPARPEPKASSARAVRPVVPAPVISVAGLGEDEVIGVMGEPHQRADLDGRKVWTYRGAGCRVEVTFFRDVTRGVYSALAHKVVRTDTGAAVDPGTPCVRGVRSAARE